MRVNKREKERIIKEVAMEFLPQPEDWDARADDEKQALFEEMNDEARRRIWLRGEAQSRAGLQKWLNGGLNQSRVRAEPEKRGQRIPHKNTLPRSEQVFA